MKPAKHQVYTPSQNHTQLLSNLQCLFDNTPFNDADTAERVDRDSLAGTLAALALKPDDVDLAQTDRLFAGLPPIAEALPVFHALAGACAQAILAEQTFAFRAADLETLVREDACRYDQVQHAINLVVKRTDEARLFSHAAVHAPNSKLREALEVFHDRWHRAGRHATADNG